MSKQEKVHKTVVFAEDMTDVMLEKVLTTSRNAFQLQVTVRTDLWNLSAFLFN